MVGISTAEKLNMGLNQPITHHMEYRHLDKVIVMLSTSMYDMKSNSLANINCREKT